ncbi:hypothetical protein XENOCAPTIV_020691 [Xenoophorus captivus]|uniref:Uncharacterized protein n=1 Tax=Xenoophorus captivus TaxID=1517983 RepID=A0ABV0Q689_9TELE
MYEMPNGQPEGRWVEKDVFLRLRVCFGVYEGVNEWPCRCWSFVPHLKQLLHPPIYLSHAQKVLPQTVTVPQPYLRFPWRFLPHQVGNAATSLFISLHPHCVAPLAHSTYITRFFVVCRHVFFNSLRGLKLQFPCTVCSHKNLVYIVQISQI